MSVDLELTESLSEDYDDLGEATTGPLYATAPPRYVGGPIGSNSGRFISPRGGAVNVRFKDAVLKANQFNAFRAQVQSDMIRIANSIRSINQTIAAQSNTNMMSPLFTMMLGPPKVKEMKVDEIKDANGAVQKGYENYTVKLKDTSYKMDITTLLPLFLPIMLAGNQPGSQNNMFGSQNPMFMMLFMFMIMKMNEEKDK